MTFQQSLDRYPLAEVETRIAAKRPADVEAALAAAQLGLDDFMALLSPAAAAYLEPLAQRAHRLTVQRFGKTILMYAPLYLSNECTNGCRYCGFNARNTVPRRTLALDEIAAEAQVLHERGFRHLLLVTGEAPHAADTAYLAGWDKRVYAVDLTTGKLRWCFQAERGVTCPLVLVNRASQSQSTRFVETSMGYRSK